ncbi:hypothetical protein GIB67_028930, partial [Kingdonia uniflora]
MCRFIAEVFSLYPLMQHHSHIVNFMWHKCISRSSPVMIWKGTTGDDFRCYSFTHQSRLYVIISRINKYG